MIVYIRGTTKQICDKKVSSSSSFVAVSLLAPHLNYCANEKRLVVSTGLNVKRPTYVEVLWVHYISFYHKLDFGNSNCESKLADLAVILYRTARSKTTNNMQV